MGMQGIFYGQAIGQVILTMFYFRICYNIDWELQVEEIRLQNEEIEENKKSLETTSAEGALPIEDEK
jgi:hypothetical protein